MPVNRSLLRLIIALGFVFLGCGLKARTRLTPPSFCKAGETWELVIRHFDHDGFGEGTPFGACVGTPLLHDGRRYFDDCIDPIGFCAAPYSLLLLEDSLSDTIELGGCFESLTLFGDVADLQVRAATEILLTNRCPNPGIDVEVGKGKARNGSSVRNSECGARRSVQPADPFLKGDLSCWDDRRDERIVVVIDLPLALPQLKARPSVMPFSLLVALLPSAHTSGLPASD
jgi:hypothetical protein